MRPVWYRSSSTYSQLLCERPPVLWNHYFQSASNFLLIQDVVLMWKKKPKVKS